jgi:hypothetical protein
VLLNQGKNIQKKKKREKNNSPKKLKIKRAKEEQHLQEHMEKDIVSCVGV